MRIALSLIRESSQKMRTSWDEEALEELKQSIKEQSVIVPVKVRPEDGIEECSLHGLEWLSIDGAPIVNDSEPCVFCTELRAPHLIEDEEVVGLLVAATASRRPVQFKLNCQSGLLVTRGFRFLGQLTGGLQ